MMDLNGVTMKFIKIDPEKAAAVLKEIVIFSLVTIEIALGMRVLLRFLGAAPQAPFVKWLDKFTRPLAYPFLGMFPERVRGVRAILELSVVFGMIMYAVLAYLFLALIDVLFQSSRK